MNSAETPDPSDPRSQQDQPPRAPNDDRPIPHDDAAWEELPELEDIDQFVDSDRRQDADEGGDATDVDAQRHVRDPIAVPGYGDDAAASDAAPAGPASNGSGAWLEDAAGNRYFDAFTAAAASSLGYAWPEVVAAIGRQAGRWIGDTPLAPDPLTLQAAEQIAQRTFAGQVAFTASGSEANEAAIRLVRWRGRGQRHKIITFAGSYHGATLGSLTASGDPGLHQHVGPLAAGFTYCPYGDPRAVAAAIDDATAAILVQPVQTHDQMRLPPDGFLASLRELADEHDLLLVADETQLPIGLSGDWTVCQHAGVQPDLLTLAAGLAGGVGTGVLVMRDGLADDLPSDTAWPARHDPLAAAAVVATLQAIQQDDWLQHARQIAQRMAEELAALREDFDLVRSASQLGMLVGVELDVDAETVVASCRRRGLLLGQAGDNTLRLQPPLVTTADDLQHILAILRGALESAQRQPAET